MLGSRNVRVSWHGSHQLAELLAQIHASLETMESVGCSYCSLTFHSICRFYMGGQAEMLKRPKAEIGFYIYRFFKIWYVYISGNHL